MKLGIGLNYSGAKMDLKFGLAQRAEELGFHSVSTAETYGSDAITPLAYLAAPALRNWRRARRPIWPCARRPSTPRPVATA